MDGVEEFRHYKNLVFVHWGYSGHRLQNNRHSLSQKQRCILKPEQRLFSGLCQSMFDLIWINQGLPILAEDNGAISVAQKSEKLRNIVVNVLMISERLKRRLSRRSRIHITLEQDPPGPCDLGDTDVTLTVTDDKDASDSCEATVIVVDEEPPVISSVTARPNRIWPPE